MTTTNVLFEVGLEEMPARFMSDTEKQLHEKTIAWLASIRLKYDQLHTFITPRRFAVQIIGLETKQDDEEEEVKGPAVKIAKDEANNWTKAAIGFTKGQGKSVEDIYTKEVNGTEYIFVKKFTAGQSVDTLLPDFKSVILDLHFPKNMRWSNQTLRYIRPIKWLVALRDEQIIPFEITNVKTSNYTFGHRFLGGKTVITKPEQYEQLLNEQHVIVDSNKRQQKIVNEIKELEQQHNWVIPIDESLLEEVTHLVEYPTVFYGEFEKRFLDIPKEVLITSMKEHQRYFPVMNHTSELQPFFVAVRNGTNQHIEKVAKGNEKVLRARLQDAQFFYEEDQQLSIERNVQQLSKMVFQEQLGTIADKVNRVNKIAKIIARKLSLQDDVTQKVTRASEICKFDLVTNMVNEFTELQGVMGHKYALIFGEDKEVAQAIEEHYLPKSAKSELPKSLVGSVVSVADKLDTIIGCFTVGLIPSGSQDPYALRRQALGIVQIVKERNWDINISELIKEVQQLYIDFTTSEEMANIHEQLHTFFKQRAAYIMKEENIEQDVVEAVLAGKLEKFAFMIEKAHLLSEKRNDLSFKTKQEAFVRVLNLASKVSEEVDVDPQKFKNNEEKALFEKYQAIHTDYLKALTNKKASVAIELLSQLVTPINAFFDHTMVMDKDESIKMNRLALLSYISKDIKQFADLTEINWKQTHS
jgi:glycyl-tRNA synthetase beta chain